MGRSGAGDTVYWKAEGERDMDWLNGMNRVTEEIEGMLEGPANYGRLAGLVGCSVYE